MGGEILILVLLVLLGVMQIMAINIFWQRFILSLRTQEPPVAKVVVRSYGDDASASARVLARYTRLDLGEIDEIVFDRRTGPLPLPLPWGEANRLATELRRLGGDAVVEHR